MSRSHSNALHRALAARKAYENAYTDTLAARERDNIEHARNRRALLVTFATLAGVVSGAACVALAFPNRGTALLVAVLAVGLTIAVALAARIAGKAIP